MSASPTGKCRSALLVFFFFGRKVTSCSTFFFLSTESKRKCKRAFWREEKEFISLLSPPAEVKKCMIKCV